MGEHRFRNLPAILPGKGEVFMADPRLLVVDETYNCRDMTSPETVAHIDWLADEIEARGFDPNMPLTVKRSGDDAILVRGHCRHAACMKLIGKGVELLKIPVMQRPSGMNDIDLIFDQEVSNSGLRLDELAKARLCLKARRAGVDDDEIARRMHWKSVNSVKDHIALLEAPEPLQQEVRNGAMSATTARRLHEEHGESAPEIAAKAKADVQSRGKNRITPRAVARVIGKAKPKPAEINFDFVSIANQVEDAAKRAGGIDKLGPEQTKALLRQQISALHKAKGQKVEEPSPAEVTDEEKAARAQALADAKAREQAEWEAAGPGAQRGAPIAKVLEKIEAITTPSQSDPEVQRTNLVKNLNDKLFKIVAKLAQIAEESCIGERAPGESIPVPIEVLQQADTVYRQSIGEIAA